MISAILCDLCGSMIAYLTSSVFCVLLDLIIKVVKENVFAGYMWVSFVAIGFGAALGALLRWWLGMFFNSVFPPIPLGTLAANIIGCFLIGIVMEVTRHHLFLPEPMRLGIITGFLGGLTTFSTFSAETVTLISHQEYFLSASIILAHLAGSLLSTIFGIYTIKFVTS